MYEYRNILVLVDRSSANDSLIRYANFLGQDREGVSFCFLNIQKDISIPEEVLKQFPEIWEKDAAERKEYLHEKIDAIFSQSDIKDFDLEVKKGHPVDSILETVHARNIDLVLVGKKPDSAGSGILVQRLARRLDCSLLIVPAGQEPRLSKVLLTTDFSAYSGITFQKMAKLFEGFPQLQMEAIHIYQVPSGYHYSGKTLEEFKEIMEEHSRLDFKRFIRKLKLDHLNIKGHFVHGKGDQVPRIIHDKAKELGADLISLSAKGRTFASAILIGSMAEKLIKQNYDYPMLITRKKGAPKGLFALLRELGQPRS